MRQGSLHGAAQMEPELNGYAECQECPRGKCLPLVGLVGRSSCQSCADNMAITGTAAIDRAQSVCPKGLAPLSEDSVFYEACHGNICKDAVGSNECTACLAGRSTKGKCASGVTSCGCDIGICLSTDSAECKDCGPLSTTNEIEPVGAVSNEVYARQQISRNARRAGLSAPCMRLGRVDRFRRVPGVCCSGLGLW